MWGIGEVNDFLAKNFNWEGLRGDYKNYFNSSLAISCNLDPFSKVP